MPRRTDIHSILIIGSGPIVIGQGCEFDYSGVQACRALKEEGYRVVLINSNPATIMTDPEFADATYVEPISPEAVEKILQREKEAGTPIDALLPTLGGQTGLNTGMACWDKGILQKYGVKMIGADRDAIHRGEDRQVFKELMISIGLKVPRSGVVHNMDDARKVLADIGLPLIIRPAFTLGGTGGGIAYNVEEFETIVQRGLDASPVTEVLIEQSVIGWKEFEMEVMRDKNDNVVIICSIENLDAMGVHTGDSITVAPIQTLTDKEYQRMRDASIAVIRAVGVETGGSNIQFAINPDNGEMVVVEMNPRVSRSSALASKATGYPIAKLAAKLAVGYTLDELPNYITSKRKGSGVRGQGSDKAEWEMYTSACFEPTIDYCVIKIPRWTFEKFPDADETLTTQMKSVGEAMAIGRTFKEALQKGIRSMEVKRFGFGLDGSDKSLKAGEWPIEEEKLRRKLAVPSQGRLYYVRYALKMGWSVEQVHELSHYDPWFIAQMKKLVDFERELIEIDQTAPRWRDPELEGHEKAEKYIELIRRAKNLGYSDVQLATIWGVNTGNGVGVFRNVRQWFGIKPVYKIVDTCAAEFEASTPYYYSTYETPYTVNGKAVTEDEIRLTDKPKVVIIGGGPNRIGQGIEFDYCCVQAAFACREMGLESVMINSNPETVSTDYDTSDLLFFEPLTHEDILNICERLNGRPFSEKGGLVKGVIVQFGGQTPLNLARGLMESGVPILGTTVASLDRAGDREQFRELLQSLGLKQPANGIAKNLAEAKKIAAEIGYPVLVRPSFVLGGRAMEIVSDETQLEHFMKIAQAAAGENPILIDKFLDAATEVDVDCLADFSPDGEGSGVRGQTSTSSVGAGSEKGGRAVIIGVMEHIEEAGIHSGDSACSLPPYSLSPEMVARLKDQTRKLAAALKVRGLMNVQYAIKGNDIYVIEVNPRASRTVPFVGKATGTPWAKIAAKVMMGASLDELGVKELPDPKHVSVKEVVFPFTKFPGVDVILGPEMRSTGEVMGIADDFATAFAKSQLASGTNLPLKGTVFISVRSADRDAIVPVGRMLSEAGFKIVATEGTAMTMQAAGVPVTRIPKLSEGRPNIRDLIKNGQVQLILNTPTKKGPATDEGKIRAMAVLNKVPMITTLTGAVATAKAIVALQKSDWGVKPLQAYK
jgi:carbamoyl-phosphate synthase large subunit